MKDSFPSRGEEQHRPRRHIVRSGICLSMQAHQELKGVRQRQQLVLGRVRGEILRGVDSGRTFRDGRMWET